MPQSWAAHYRASFLLGLPLIGSHLAQMLTNTTDVLMLGWYGVEPLAAATLAMQLYFVIFIVGSGFAFAVMPMVATAHGASDHRQVRRCVRMGTWLCLIYAALFMVVLWFSEPVFIAFGQDPHLSSLAQDYLRIALFGMAPSILIMVLKSYLSALNRAGIVLWATLIGALANAVFNYALIFGNWGFPELGLKGAAIASVLTQTLAFLFLVAYAYLLPALKSYEMFSRFWVADWQALKEVFRLGWPIGLTMLAESGLFAATTLMIGWIGTIPLATHGIVIQIAALMFMIPLGMSNVATIRAGHALGAGAYQDLYRGSISVIAIGIAIACLTMTLLVTQSEFLISLFLDKANPEYSAIIAYGGPLVMVAALFQLADAMQVIMLGLLRGVKDTAVPMILAIFAYWIVGLPAGYVLAFHFDLGGVGVWLGLVAGLALAAVTMGWRYKNLLQKLAQT